MCSWYEREQRIRIDNLWHDSQKIASEQSHRRESYKKSVVAVGLSIAVVVEFRVFSSLFFFATEYALHVDASDFQVFDIWCKLTLSLASLSFDQLSVEVNDVDESQSAES